MTKLTRLSLVAAVAVAGLTNVNAASLEEAIKGVQISGNVSYYVENVTNNPSLAGSNAATRNDSQHDLDISVQALIPVTDNISATIRVDENGDQDSANSSKSVDVNIDRVYFTYKNDGTTVNAGLIGTPLTDGGQADGINVSKTLGSVTLGAGYLYTTSTTNSDEVAFATVAGSMAPVSYSLAYAKVISATDANEADYMTAALSTTVANVSLGANYGSRSNKAGSEDQSQYKLSASTNAGIVGIALAYAANDKNGGETLIDESDVAASNISLAGLDLAGLGDASAYQVKLTANVTAMDTVSATYASASVEGGNDKTAAAVSYTHAFAKNFKVYTNYEILDVDTVADNKTEYTLGAAYSF